MKSLLFLFGEVLKELGKILKKLDRNYLDGDIEQILFSCHMNLAESLIVLQLAVY